MSHPFRRTLASVTVAGLAGAGAIVGGASPAQSLPDPEDRVCPEAFPVDELAAGQLVDGLTVSSGNVPDVFTGEVLGVLDSGIATGLDMILVRLTNDEIDRVGGIWAGMSGSPVYAADGRLIGAVSYGLSWGSSPVAGVTPAADMQEVLDQSAGAARGRAEVPLSRPMQQRLVSSGAATAREADSGLTRLPVPVTVSGITNQQRLAKVGSKLGLGPVSLYRGGAAPTAQAEPADEIFAGSNYAASLAYGDFSAVGTGTTTFVCDGSAVGFGHPFSFSGPTSLTMHGADAIYIQEDSLGAPFKVSNPTGPVGTVDQDRLAAISGVLGVVPDTSLITTTVSKGPRSRTGETRVSLPDYTADATAFGFLANLDRVFDKIGKGSSDVSFTITGETAAGAPFTVNRSNRFVSDFDVTYESIFEPADAVFSLLNNEVTDVTITDVTIDAELEDSARSFRVKKVERRTAGVYSKITRKTKVYAKPGQMMRFRVTLESSSGPATPQVLVKVRMPEEAQVGARGSLSVGAAFGGFEEFFFSEEDLYGEFGNGPKSFQEVIDGIEDAPRNDELSATIELYDGETDEFLTDSASVPAGEVVSNAKYFKLRVGKQP